MTAKRVICIDDELGMLELLKVILGRHGFLVECAASGREGLALAQQTPADLIILDLMMPDMDGWQVLAKLRADAALQHTPVLLLSGQRQHTIDIKSANGYLSKPFSLHQLIEAAQNILDNPP